MSKLYLLLFLILLFSCDHPESAEFDRSNRTSLKSSSSYETSSNTVIENVDESNSNVNQNNDNTYKVIGIRDGDTFDILMDGQKQGIRFAHIDCPEKKQPFGQKAKQFVSDLCFGKYVALHHNNKYHRDRLIAEVILEDGRNLNKLLVENGLAWHYKKYSNDEDYSILEIAARKQAIGLWSDPNPIEPERWRN